MPATAEIMAERLTMCLLSRRLNRNGPSLDGRPTDYPSDLITLRQAVHHDIADAAETRVCCSTCQSNHSGPQHKRAMVSYHSTPHPANTGQRTILPETRPPHTALTGG